MGRKILIDVHKYSKLPNVPQTLHFHKNTNMTASHPLNADSVTPFPLLLANESRNIRNILVKYAGQFRLRPCLIFVFSSEVLPWATEHTWTAILRCAWKFQIFTQLWNGIRQQGPIYTSPNVTKLLGDHFPKRTNDVCYFVWNWPPTVFSKHEGLKVIFRAFHIHFNDVNVADENTDLASIATHAMIGVNPQKLQHNWKWPNILGRQSHHHAKERFDCVCCAHGKHQQRVQISTNTKYTTLVTKKVNTPTPSNKQPLLGHIYRKKIRLCWGRPVEDRTYAELGRMWVILLEAYVCSDVPACRHVSAGSACFFPNA